jgi:hypothetical protein
MDNKIVVKSWGEIECKTQENKLEDNYKNYLLDSLKQYKKLLNSQFTSDDRDYMFATQKRMSNKLDLSKLSVMLHKDIVDEKGNNFVHIAIEKRDIESLRWLIDAMQHPLSIANKEEKEPIDLCIDLLKPEAKDSFKQSAHDMLEILTAGYDKINFERSHRIIFLKKIIQLQLEYIKQGSRFKLKDVLFTRFLASNSAEKAIELSEIYQEVCDKEGNTFAHILVEQGLSDMLYEFVKKDYITFAKNNNEQNAFDLAEKLCPEHDSDTDSSGSLEMSKDVDEAYCCYRILLNYLKQQRNDKNFKRCCDKHIFKK